MQKRQRERIPRCRMYLRRELGWLPGFPVGQGEGHVSWMPAPRLGVEPARPVELDEARLRRAASAWTRLVRDFPRALPRVVAELDRWKEGVPRILGWLTAAVQDGERVPVLVADGACPPDVAARSERLAGRRPALGRVLGAASWSGLLTSGELPGMLDWTESNADAVEDLLAERPGLDGVVDILTLWALAGEDEQCISRFLRFVQSRSTRLAAALEGEYCDAFLWEAELRKAKLREAEVRKFVTCIGRRKEPERRRALRVLGSTLHDGLLDEDRLGFLDLNRFREVVRADNADFYRDMLWLLDRLPGAHDAKFRTSFLKRWCYRWSWEFRRVHVSRVLREICGYLSTRPDSTLVDPWLIEGSDEAPYGWIDRLVEDLGHEPLKVHSLAGRWQGIFDALAQAGAARCTPPVTYDDGDLIVNLAIATNDAEDACQCLLQLDEVELSRWFHLNWPRRLRGLWNRFREGWRLVVELATGTELFAAVAYRLRIEIDRGGWSSLPHLGTMNRRLVRAGWSGTTAGLIVDGHFALVEDCARRQALAGTLLGSVEPEPRRVQAPPVWAQRYPEALGPALGELAGLTGDGERIARGVLAKDFPHPGDLQREIAAIERQVATSPDARRLERLRTLRDRLRSPRPVSSVRLARLRGKLEARVRRCLIESWMRRLDAALTTAFSGLLGIDEVPAWMFDARQLRMLEAILSQPAAVRSLGLRLLRARASSGPWNLIDDPANRAYLSRLRKRGVNVEPWLNPRRRSCVGRNGRTVELAFELDPLEVFQMGARFGTCLSPDDHSFFSVFAVAADINKHVVYARDAKGTVVGRCVLALDDRGRIYTFHPYCHDGALGFDNRIADLVAELAVEMRTFAARGRLEGDRVVRARMVPCPVSGRWVDYGPVDLFPRGFPFLAEGSEFRKSLMAMEPAAGNNLVSRLEQLFAPVPLNGHALSRVIDLLEFDRRPELIRPLLPLLDGCEGLDDRAWVRALRLAAKAGESDFVGRALSERDVRHVLRRRVLRTRDGSSLDKDVMRLLVEHDPHAAIRLVRSTRSRVVRSDEDDEVVRRSYLAEAFERLGWSVRAHRAGTR